MKSATIYRFKPFLPSLRYSIKCCFAYPTIDGDNQSFRAAFTLSQTSILWWRHNMTGLASYLREIKSLSEYTPVDLRTAALKACRIWATFQAPGARKDDSFRSPVECYHYASEVPSGLPFHFSLVGPVEDRQTRLLVRDLRNQGRVIGDYPMPTTSDPWLETKCLAVFPTDHDTISVAILSAGQHSW